MRGKAGIVIGLAAGYVLGSRAGRERYEQIKTQWLKVWHLDPVQNQVDKVKDFAKSSALALPSVLWDGAVKVTKAIASNDDSPGERLDAGIDEAKKQSSTVKAAAEKDASTAKKAAAPKKPAAKKPAPKKTTTRQTKSGGSASGTRGGA